MNEASPLFAGFFGVLLEATAVRLTIAPPPPLVCLEVKCAEEVVTFLEIVYKLNE